MSDPDLTALLDELDAANARAKAAVARSEALADAVHWLTLGANALTSDALMPDVSTSTVLIGNGPVKQEDAATAASLYALRHGVMVAYAALRDDASSELRETARSLAMTLDIHAPDLAERSEREMAKLALYLKSRGVNTG